MDAIENRQQRFGGQLKAWRNRRRMSQLDFALEAEISQKHLSFIETGRSAPSRDMVIRLTECLDVPLRERNTLLLAAGYAPMYLARELDDPSLKAAREAIDLLLKGHEPYPAIAVDRHWNMVASNAAITPFLAVLSEPSLLEPPVNVLRLSLHPGGLAPYIGNLGNWKSHLLDRLRHQIEVTADPALAELAKELGAYPAGSEATDDHHDYHDYGDVFVPFELHMPSGKLAFFSTITVFGTPVDVTLSEIAIESFFPANDETRVALGG
ncbi:helix-turn-helix domain-containing protein [Kordiimonas aestuarii]|uniref:helix-turn-helix domain-containing protein n=1 Tax=Kordiimonas aestuarii TaxID=1005925 RepID=UPI0021CFEF40|nr:helix-turn-helix transcriptional regulator [Kordiimonas aestuarii]